MNAGMRTRKKVVVFGAGVTGLSAAHELAERGFEVEVVDPAIREIVHVHTRDRGIGGVARSQWTWRLPQRIASEKPDDYGPFGRTEPAQVALFDEVMIFELEGNAWKPRDESASSATIDRLRTLSARLRKELGKTAARRIHLIAPCSTAIVDPALVRKEPRIKWLLRALGDAEGELGPVVLCPSVADYRSSSAQSTPLDHCIIIEVGPLDLFPGEHGYRFFPSFYRHLFDTMRRTPITKPYPQDRTHATVYDNLVASAGLAFARAGNVKPLFVPRSKIESAEAVYQLLLTTLREFDYTIADLKLFSRKLFQYLTSSSHRRETEYENQSWSEFLELERFSPGARAHLESAPQMLAALRGSASDARTQGSITLQLLLDQFKDGGRPDALLNGPTSSAWFDHWYDYLVSQGVVFRCGKLARFGVDGRDVVPLLDSGEAVSADFFVLAMSLQAVTELAKPFIEAAKASGRPLGRDNDFSRIQTLTGGPVALAKDLEKSAPDGPLQHLSGIQFFFDVELRFWRGHTQYIDSAWGLTSISQPQFWGRRRGAADAYRSVLSVDIGTWDRPDADGVIAWNCSPGELAARVWKQILEHHDDGFEEVYGALSSIPVPIAYALDGNLEFVSEPAPAIRDVTPFMVNRVGQFRERPGTVVTTSRVSKQTSAYEVHLSRYVLAGTYMQTYTRVTSMEAANESARHAVNALLQEAKVAGDHCAIWDPEDVESSDVASLKELDSMLSREGRPHTLDILDVSR